MRLTGWLLACLVLVPACSLDRRPIVPPRDGGPDAPSLDVGPDGRDAPIPDVPDLDAPELDAPVDGGVDAPSDGGVDAPIDAGPDAPDPCAACGADQICCAGVCYQRLTDPLHCGSCDACVAPPNASPLCASGSCDFTCTAGFDDCNALAGDGCEASLGTVSHCTACGDVCTDYLFTTERCGASGCQYECDAGRASCDGALPDCETDTQTSTMHCGGCGRACAVGQTCVAGACRGWRPLATSGAPSPRYDHVAVWTGTEMIVWGGQNGAEELGDGARYDPATDVWRAMSATGAPSARRSPVFVWTGRRLVVWSGYRRGAGWLDGGAIYDPATDTWAAIGNGGAPAARSRSSGVWTGSEMLFWGGWDGSFGGVINDGAAFTPTSTWDGLPGTGLAARRFHGTVWTGSRMVVWGGEGAGGFLGSGGRYDRPGDAWAGVSGTGAPSARQQHAMVWVAGAARVVVWGGLVATGMFSDGGTASGGRYDPAADAWTATASSPLSARFDVGVAASDGEMFVFGGRPDDETLTPLGDGARYAPATDTWTALPSTGAPSARAVPSAVWTGAELIVFGGLDGAGAVGTGAALRP